MSCSLGIDPGELFAEGQRKWPMNCWLHTCACHRAVEVAPLIEYE